MPYEGCEPIGEIVVFELIPEFGITVPSAEDWPILNALINTAGGASWVSFHHGGGVGMGYSLHAGMVIVADGTDDAERRLRRVLNNDPAMGVIRHADAGYDIAQKVQKDMGMEF